MPDTLHDDPPTMFEKLREMQGETLQNFGQQMFGQLLPGAPATLPQPADAQQWAMVGGKLQKMWLDYAAEQVTKGQPAMARLFDPVQMAQQMQTWWQQLPMGDPAIQKQMWEDGLALWQTVLGQFGIGPAAATGEGEAKLPRSDRRFADPKWREQPVFALIHQTYLMLSDQLMTLAQKTPGLDEQARTKLAFNTKAMVEALSPAHFPLTNPVVLERTLATKGDNLVKGMEHLLTDLRKGQLTHTDPDAFEVGRNIAVTPGKVVHETPLYQLIQYTPTTPDVLSVPLVIFPPWINRFYILDLNEKKSFIRWAVAQGISVFVVSWKSADASIADVMWDDYVLGEVEAIDTVRARLDVPAVHTIGYCVAGTTLAAALAMLARRGEAGKVKSATFFTAQVDFELSGELRMMVDEQNLKLIDSMTTDGTFDGRYMAATFNMLRGPDLIWNYVINN